MPTASKTERLNFRLPRELKSVIEEAAAALGQSVSNYAISTLVGSSRRVLEQSEITELSARDRDRFMTMLDAASVKPNKALATGARRYKRRLRAHAAERCC